MTTEAKDKPIDLFLEWFEEAKSAELVLPEAMSVASVGADGRPSSRMVLLKDADPRGFVFYTNLNSRKGSEIQANDHVALLFHWKSLKRQIRIEGPAVPVSDEEADAYFATRTAAPKSGLGRAINPPQCRDASTWRRKSQNSAQNSALERSRDRHSGPVCALCRTGSNFGATAVFGCMTG